MKIEETIKNVTENLGENKGTILTVVAVIGAVTSVALTIRSTLKAKKRLDENNGVIDKDVALGIAKDAAPAVIALGVTITAEVMAHKSDVAKYAALAALAADSKKVDQLAKKITGKDSVVEKKDHDVIKEHTDLLNVVEGPNKTEKWYDEYTGLWFETSLAELIEAERNVVQAWNNMPFRGFVSVSEFYGYLINRGSADLPASVVDDEWDTEDGAFELQFDAGMDSNMQPYKIFRFNIEPKHRDTRF